MTINRHIHDKLAQLQDLTQVGTIVKPIGFNGQMLISVNNNQNLRFLQNLEAGDFVFIGTHKPIPFLIEEVSHKEHPYANSLLLQLNGLDSNQTVQALKLTPVFVFIPREVREKQSIVTLADLQGFELINRGESIGKITAIEVTQAHFLGTVVDTLQQSFPFPLHEDFIEQIDTTSQKLYVKLPEGIFDI